MSAFSSLFFPPGLLADLQGRAETHLFSSRTCRGSAFLRLISIFLTFVPMFLMKMFFHVKGTMFVQVGTDPAASLWRRWIHFTQSHQLVMAVSWWCSFLNHCCCGLGIGLTGRKSHIFRNLPLKLYINISLLVLEGFALAEVSLFERYSYL